MITKKSYRASPIVRVSDELEQDAAAPQWLSDFATNLSKSAVQPYREEQQSIYDQINSVMNGSKSKFNSVEQAVDSMKERSGLLAYHNKIDAQKYDVQKMAQLIEEAGKKESDIKLFQLHPGIQNTINNFVTDTHGNLSIPQIIEKIKSIHSQEVPEGECWDDENLFKYINDKNIEIKKNYPDNDVENMNLGKITPMNDSEIDKSNSDALFSLTPAVIK